LFEVPELHGETILHMIKIGDFVKRSPLAALGALPIARMHQSEVVCFASDGRRDARVHPAA
jgi:hypothetical protein